MLLCFLYAKSPAKTVGLFATFSGKTIRGGKMAAKGICHCVKRLILLC